MPCIPSKAICKIPDKSAITKFSRCRFDDRIDIYDVYKVETIGGLPYYLINNKIKENGNLSNKRKICHHMMTVGKGINRHSGRR